MKRFSFAVALVAVLTLGVLFTTSIGQNTIKRVTEQYQFINGIIGVNRDTGDAELVLPENSVGPDEQSGMHMNVVFCGELAENGTTYFGPATGPLGGDGSDISIGSTGCDALDNTTEATADAPIFTNVAFKALGMYCKTDGTLGAGETLTYTLRTATADVVTTDGSNSTLTCTITAGQTGCRTLAGTTTDIAAGATVAVKAVESSNNVDDNGWCAVGIALK